MASVTVRNLDERVKERLRVAAAKSGHSMEEHLRQLIEREIGSDLPRSGFGTWMQRHFAGAAGREFEVPERDDLAEPIEFSQ